MTPLPVEGAALRNGCCSYQFPRSLESREQLFREDSPLAAALHVDLCLSDPSQAGLYRHAFWQSGVQLQQNADARGHEACRRLLDVLVVGVTDHVEFLCLLSSVNFSKSFSSSELQQALLACINLPVVSFRNEINGKCVSLSV
jgi:hypothetical protein